MVAGINRGEEVSRRVRINARALMQFTHRGDTSGQEYRALCAAIDRLDGTRIRTNVRRGDEEQHRAFGLIESATAAGTMDSNASVLRVMICPSTSFQPMPSSTK